MSYYYHKPISESIDISVLRSMREQGYTNKQIANSCGISVSTVYKYLGKKSMDVRKAAEQNKPCPVKGAELAGYSVDAEEDPMVEAVTPNPVLEPETSIDIPVKSTLKIMKEVRILDLEGILCGYHLNPISGDVEFKGDLIHGMLDKGSISAFIQELTEIQKMMEA